MLWFLVCYRSKYICGLSHQINVHFFFVRCRPEKAFKINDCLELSSSFIFFSAFFSVFRSVSFVNGSEGKKVGGDFDCLFSGDNYFHVYPSQWEQYTIHTIHICRHADCNQYYWKFHTQRTEKKSFRNNTHTHSSRSRYAIHDRNFYITHSQLFFCFALISFYRLCTIVMSIYWAVFIIDFQLSDEDCRIQSRFSPLWKETRIERQMEVNREIIILGQCVLWHRLVYSPWNVCYNRFNHVQNRQYIQLRHGPKARPTRSIC